MRVLLVHHKRIDKWLPPGGHRELKENPLETAVREVREETGIDVTSCLPSPEPLDDRAVVLPVPNYILEERIDAYDGQPEHYHLDMIYVARVPHQEIEVRAEESHEAKWFTAEEIDSLDVFENVSVLVKELLGRSTQD